VWLTHREFELVHNHDAARPPNADATIDVTHIGPAQQCTLVERSWSTASSA
jgi:hypothetical protein